MIAIHKFILTFFCLFLLTQCTNKKSQVPSIQILSPSADTQPVKSLVGDWKYQNTIWYSSELTLQENGVFIFHDQGCYGQRFSQGQWVTINNVIQLTSFDTFKQMEEPRSNMTGEIRQQKPNQYLKEGDVVYSVANLDEAVPHILPKSNDTVRVYLSKVQLQLRNDTLYCVDSNNLPEEAMFHRIKNNR